MTFGRKIDRREGCKYRIAAVVDAAAARALIRSSAAGTTPALLRPVAALKRTAAAGPGPGNRLVHDALDGACTTTALGAAAEATIDLPGRTGRRRRGDGATHVMVAEHVAGADDHEQRPNRVPRIQGIRMN